MNELYESFEPIFYPNRKYPHFNVRYYKTNNRRTAKNFSVKTYGSKAKAEEKAWDFFYDQYKHLPDHRL
jgi:hypothetical protein